MINKKSKILFFQICVVFFYIRGATQNSNETIFVLFKGTELEKKYTTNNPKDIIEATYIFTIFDSPKKKHSTGFVEFSSRRFKDFDEKDRNNPVPSFKVSKRFIKNNSDLIMTSERMQIIGYKKSFKLFREAKHIFLIDELEIENKRVLIKEVFLSYIPDSSAPIINISEQ